MCSLDGWWFCFWAQLPFQNGINQQFMPFDVSIFLLSCIIHFMFQIVCLNASAAAADDDADVVGGVCASDWASNVPYDRYRAQSKCGCWNVNGIEMGNVTCVRLVFLVVPFVFRASREREFRLLKTIRELMANHQRYIWLKMLAKIGRSHHHAISSKEMRAATHLSKENKFCSFRCNGSNLLPN